jgi:hypothetical protein
MRGYNAGLILLLGGGFCGAVEYRLPRNQTTVREDRHQVRTTAYDVRTRTPLALPAGMPASRGTVSVGYLFHEVDWEDVEPANQGDKHQVTGLLRTRVWENWGAEMLVVGTESDYAGSIAVGDLLIRAAIPLRQERYSAILLTAGWRLPIADNQELEESHGGDLDASGGELGLRWSESFGFTTTHLNLHGMFHPQATNDLDDPIVLQDGLVIPEGTFEHQYYEAQATLSVGYRLNRWLRLGVDAQGTVRRWEGDESDQDMQSERLTALGWLGVNWRPGSQVVAGFGVDPELLDEEGFDGWTWAAALELDF